MYTDPLEIGFDVLDVDDVDETFSTIIENVEQNECFVFIEQNGKCLDGIITGTAAGILGSAIALAQTGIALLLKAVE
jgi:hypothetical protein